MTIQRLEHVGSAICSRTRWAAPLASAKRTTASRRTPTCSGIAERCTEGAEIEIVEGMRETLERHGPSVICELHDTNERFAGLMDELHYRVTKLDGPEPVREAGAIHVLAQPRER